MNAKLTLTIDETIIKKAKIYAKKHGRSLSDVVENFLKILTSEQDKIDDITPVVKSLRGSFKAPESLDYKKELPKILQKKYLS